MLADPQTITVDTVPVTLPRISAGNQTGTFRNSDGTYTVIVTHTGGKRERSHVRLDVNKVGVDPLDTARSRSYSWSAWLVIDAPPNGTGFTDAEQEDAVKALTGLIMSDGFLTKILGKEA